MSYPEVDLNVMAGQKHVTFMNNTVTQIQDGQQHLNGTTSDMIARNSGLMNIAANDAYGLLGEKVTKVGVNYGETADGIHYGLQVHTSADADAAGGFNYGR